MNEKTKKQETFVIRILGTENSTWQGSVTWVEQKKQQYFRSDLELLKMIDGAVGQNDSPEAPGF